MESIEKFHYKKASSTIIHTTPKYMDLELNDVEQLFLNRSLGGGG